MKLPDPEPDHGHPSQETRDLRPDDAFLRAHGWAIEARPGGRAPNLWRHPASKLPWEEAEALLVTRLAASKEGRDAVAKAVKEGERWREENARR